MKIIRVTPRGYCFGVLNSIKQAKMARIKYPDLPIYLLGYLVHNQAVIDELKKSNITLLHDVFLDKINIIDNIKTPAVLILSAHGSSVDVKNKALANHQLIVIDTECSWVTKTKTIVQQHLDQKEHVIFIGVKNHPETDAITSLSSNIHLIANIEEAKNLAIPYGKIFATNQTTLSVLDIVKITQFLEIKFHNRISFANDICQATSERQKAILNLKGQKIDLLIVVGDSFSNNTNKLVEIGKSININTVRISNLQQLDKKILKNVETVAVTAGASTPTIIQMAVIEYLENYK